MKPSAAKERSQRQVRAAHLRFMAVQNERFGIR
jgi:hypothetical protein